MLLTCFNFLCFLVKCVIDTNEYIKHIHKENDNFCGFSHHFPDYEWSWIYSYMFLLQLKCLLMPFILFLFSFFLICIVYLFLIALLATRFGYELIWIQTASQLYLLLQMCSKCGFSFHSFYVVFWFMEVLNFDVVKSVISFMTYVFSAPPLTPRNPPKSQGHDDTKLYFVLKPYGFIIHI